jgi:penicillin-binding protein 1A
LKRNGPSDYEPNKPNNNGLNNPNNRPNYNQSGNNNHGNRKPSSGIPGFKGPVKKNSNSGSKQNIPNNNGYNNTPNNSGFNNTPNNNGYNRSMSNNNNNNDYYSNLGQNNNRSDNPNVNIKNNMRPNGPIDKNKFNDGYMPNKMRPGFKKSPGKNGPKKFLSKKNLFLALKISLVLFIVGILAVTGVIINAIYSYNKSELKVSDEQLSLDNLTTTIYDGDGEICAQLNNGANKDFVPLSQIPEDLQNAFIALEDERFREHNGFDAFGFARGMLTTVLGKSSGGSTLTMQLVKNITEESERSYKRKIIEIYRAINIEKRLTKDKILEKYLNIIYMGTDVQGEGKISVYGVKAAAIRFFDKDISEDEELTLAECAVISGITQNPIDYMPKNEENQDNIKNKARYSVLPKMLEQGYIDEAQYEKALTELDTMEFKNVALNYAVNTEQSYFVDAVIEQAIDEISEKTGATETEVRSWIYTKGYKIYTTIDTKVQEKMDEVFLDEDTYFAHNGEKYTGEPKKDSEGNDITNYNIQAGMVILDPETGYVKALYGGRGSKKTNSGSNLATGYGGSGRPPGSSFKPVSVFAPALENGTINPGTVIDDYPLYTDNTKTERKPKNASANKYYGLITSRKALTVSSNVVTTRLYNEYLDTDYILDTLGKLNLYDEEINSDLDKSYNLPLGQSINATPLSMGAAYCTFANGGVYNEATTYTKIVDSENQTVIDKTKADKNQTVVFSEQTSYLITDMLKDVLDTSEGTATGYGITNKNGKTISAAGKTGTTSSATDRWFVGYTPYYVGSVWYGDENSYPLPSTTSKDHLKIWNAVMEAVHEDLEPADFEKPIGIVEMDLCKYSGDLPSSICSKDPEGNAIHTEIVNEKYKPTSKCTVHVENNYCLDAYEKTGRYYVAGANCTNVVKKVLRQRDNGFYEVPVADLKYIIDIAYTSFTGDCPIHGGGTYSGEDPDASETPTETPTESDETESPTPTISDPTDLPTITVTDDVTIEPTETPTDDETTETPEPTADSQNNGNN